MILRPIHLSTLDGMSGAAIAARRLHEGLLAIGVPSQMMVAHKTTDALTVVAEPAVVGDTCGKVLSRIGAHIYAAQRKRRSDVVVRPGVYFSDDRVPGIYRLGNVLRDADLLHLHWVAGYVDYRKFFRSLSPSVPLVWTLHDMNPFTGGCHQSLGCRNFEIKCGSCVELGSTKANDASANSHSRKLSALAKLAPNTTRIVSPSRWLAAEAKASSAMGGFQIDVVPNGVDVELFCPRERTAVREALGLSKTDVIVAFVAETLASKHKGFDLLCEALSRLEKMRDVKVLAIGASGNVPSLGFEVIRLGRVENERFMALALSAADLFVLPTRVDNFPNVILEAMACGVPVVSFDVGGVPDQVAPGVTGLLAKPGDVVDLADAISSLLGDVKRREDMGRESRKAAVEKFSLPMQAHRYLEIYGELSEAAERFRLEAAENR